MEYSTGDRVRVLTNGRIPFNTKANIYSIDASGTIVVKAKVDGEYIVEGYNEDQLEPVLGSTGGIETVRSLEDITYAGTGLPEELAEVFKHLDKAVQDGATYLAIEKHLVSLGYNLRIVRKAFKMYSGMDCSECVNPGEAWNMSPATIPGFTYAWGESKGKKGVYYFVAPHAKGYVVFCQEDDMHRIETETYPTSADAVAGLEKLVKDVHRWDAPMKDVLGKKPKTQKVDNVALRFNQPQLYMQAFKLVGKLNDNFPPSEHVDVVNAMYINGSIEQELHDMVISIVGDAEKQMETEAAEEKLREMEQDEMERPIKNEISENTPNDYFQRKKLEKRYDTLPANVVDSVYQYINNVNEGLHNFSVTVSGHKYSTLQIGDGAKEQVPGAEPDIMNSVASISVLLDIMNKKATDNTNRKMALMVFSILGNEIMTSDVIKGEDENSYALTDEGMNRYFADRNLSEKAK